MESIERVKYMNQPFKLNLQSTMKDVDVLMSVLFTQKQDSAFTVFDNLTDAQILATLKNKNIGLNKTSTALVLVVKNDGTLYKKTIVDTTIVVETYSNGTDWYRIWSDGWIEQGGVGAITSGYGPVTLLVPFTTTNYNVLATQTHGVGVVPYDYSDIISIDSMAVSAFRILAETDAGGAVTGTVVWEAKGY